MRAGFGLVEVIVAVTILSVAVLGMAATSTYAARLLREARARERAAVVATNVLDSLLQRRAPTAAERTIGRYRVRWRVRPGPAGSLLRLTISYGPERDVRRLVFGARHAAPPPALRTGQ